MAVISIDDKRWPIVMVKYPVEFTGEEFDAYIKALTRLIDGVEPFAILTDVASGVQLTPAQRKRIADAVALANEKRTLIAMATIVRSRLTRGVLTALEWLVPSGCPHKPFEDLGQALTWIQARVQDRLRTSA